MTSPYQHGYRYATLTCSLAHFKQVPGAVNHFYKSNVTDEGTMRPAEHLREHFRALLGDRAPDHTVMYCGSGVSACHNVLAMEHAGLSGARLYPGSWSEWSSDGNRPVERSGKVEK